MGNSVTTYTTNQINPTETNTEKKHWWITIKLAHLLNYLSSKIIIGAFIRWADWDEWAINILWPHSYNMATNSGANQFQDAEVQAAPAQEEQGIQTELSLYELEMNFQETKELQKKLADIEKEKKEFQSELDRLKAELTKMQKLSEQLPGLVEETEKLKQEREKSKKGAESSQTELTTKDGKINGLTAQVELLKDEKEVFAKYFAAQAEQLEKFQKENELLLKNNGKLNSSLDELKKGYNELEEAIKKQEEEFSKKLKQQCERIPILTGKLVICIREFAEKIEKLEAGIKEKDTEINNLKIANKESDEAKQGIEIQKDKTISDQGNEIEKLNEQLSQSKKSLEDANKELKAKDGTIQLLTDENTNVNEGLQAQVSELEENLSKKEQELKEQLNQVDSLQKKSKHMGALQEKCQTLREEKGKLEESLGNKRQELEQVKHKNAELEGEVSQLNGNINTQTVAANELQGDLVAKGQEIDALNEKFGLLEEEKRKLEESLGKKQQELERIKSELERNIGAKDLEVKKLQEELNKKEEEYRELEKAQIKLQESNGELTHSIEEKQLELEQIISEKKELEGNVSTKEAELKDKEREYEALFEKNNSELTHSLEEKKQELERVIIESGQLAEKISELQNDIGTKDARMEQLQKDLTAKDTQLKKKDEECKALEEERTTLKQTNGELTNSLEEKRQELERIKSELDRNIGAKDLEVKKLQEELNNKGEEYRELEEAQVKLQQNNDELTHSLEEKQRELDRMILENTEIVRGLNNEITELLLQLKDLNAQSKRMEELTAQLEEMVKLEAKLQSQKDENQDLFNKFNESTLENNIKLEALRADLVDAKASTQKMTGENLDLKKQLKSSREEHEATKGELTHKIDELTENLDEKQDQHEAELEGLNKKLAETEVDNNRLKGKIDGLNVQLDQLQKKADELKTHKASVEAWKTSAVKGNKELLGEIDELKREAINSSQQNKALNAELNREKAYVKRLKDIVSERDKTINSLSEIKKQVENLQIQLKAGEDKARQLQAEKKGLNDQLKIGENALNELQLKYDEMMAMTNDSMRILYEENKNLKNGESKEISRLDQELKQEKEKLEDANRTLQEKIEELRRMKAVDAVSMSRVSGKSNGSSSLLLFRSPNKLLTNQSLEEFLSDKNEALKKSFPELEGKHFCHTAVKEVTKCLSNESDGKFKNDRLRTLLEENLQNLARNITKKRVIEVINTDYDDGKAINAALLNVTANKNTIEDKLLSSIKKCMKKLKFDKQDAVKIRNSALQKFMNIKNGGFYDGEKKIGEALSDATKNREILEKELLISIKKCISELNMNEEDAVKIRDSALQKFTKKESNNNEGLAGSLEASVMRELLKAIVIKELVEAIMGFFISKVENLELVPSIRDKFLSSEKQCSQSKVKGESDTYQLNQRIIDKYKTVEGQQDNVEAKENNGPHSSMDTPSAKKSHAASAQREGSNFVSKFTTFMS